MVEESVGIAPILRTFTARLDLPLTEGSTDKTTDLEAIHRDRRTGIQQRRSIQHRKDTSQVKLLPKLIGGQSLQSKRLLDLKRTLKSCSKSWRPTLRISNSSNWY